MDLKKRCDFFYKCGQHKIPPEQVYAFLEKQSKWEYYWKKKKKEGKKKKKGKKKSAALNLNMAKTYEDKLKIISEL